MYPPNARSALVSQLETEAIMRDLTSRTFRHWLPHVRSAVLPESLTAAGELPPNLAGIGASQRLWEYYLEQLLEYGIQLVWGGEALNTYEALGGVVRDLPRIGLRPLPAGTGRDPGQALELNAEARQVIARILGQHIEAVEDLDRRLAALPDLDTLRSNYAAGVRNRMKNLPDAEFRALAKQLDEGLAAGEGEAKLKARVQEHLSDDSGNWKHRAATVARTESAAIQSSATIEAARLRNNEIGENLTQVWLTTLDERVRPTHAAAEGQRVPLGSEFVIGGASLRFPGDPEGPPDEAINCRCRTAILAADEALPDRSEVDWEAEAAEAAENIEYYDTLDASAAQQDSLPYDNGGIVLGAGELKISAADIRDVVTAPMLELLRKASTMGTYRSFTSTLAVLGEPTDDGRMLASDMDFRFRDFPLPLMWQKQSSEGHFASYTVGVIEDAAVIDSKVVGSGYFLDTPEADEAVVQVQHGITGPSVDLSDAEWVLTDSQGNTLSETDAYSMWDNGIDEKITQKFTSAKLLAATLVATPAFGSTSIELGADVERGQEAAALVASAATAFVEVAYPDSYFADPKFTSPALPQVDSVGRVKGHLALWNTCHTGIQDRCVMAPRSATDYAYFHTSPPMLTESGRRVKVGRLTVGTGHADRHLGMWPAAEHYDDTGTCFARVHLGEDEFGIWFSGVIEPDLDPALVRKGIGAPLSGDWRSVGGSLELVAALAVNTPGFPVIASGATDSTDAPLSLVASLGPCRDEQPFNSEAFVSQVVRGIRRADRRTAEAAALVEQVMVRRRVEAVNLIARVRN